MNTLARLKRAEDAAYLRHVASGYEKLSHRYPQCAGLLIREGARMNHLADHIEAKISRGNRVGGADAPGAPVPATIQVAGSPLLSGADGAVNVCTVKDAGCDARVRSISGRA